MIINQTLLLIIAILAIVGSIVAIENPFKIGIKEDAGIIENSMEIGEEISVGVDVGQRAPNFALESRGGGIVKLSDFRGKAVMVNFWAGWCPFCIDEMPDMQKVYDELKGQGFEILAINRGENRDVAFNYLDRTLPVKVTYTIVTDPNEEVSNVYILYGMPVSYFVDKNGIIRDRKFGPLTFEEIREKAVNLLNV